MTMKGRLYQTFRRRLFRRLRLDAGSASVSGKRARTWVGSGTGDAAEVTAVSVIAVDGEGTSAPHSPQKRKPVSMRLPQAVQCFALFEIGGFGGISRGELKSADVMPGNS